MENTCSFVFASGVLCVAAIRVLVPLAGARRSHAEEVVLSIVGVCGWLYSLFFMLGFQSTGPFVVSNCSMTPCCLGVCH